LKEIPEEIGHLRNLESLQLSHNQITFLPDSICHLSKLVELKIAHNHLEQLTPLVSHLKRLEILDLENNRLHEFTLRLDNFSKLNMLDISFNPITVLPAELMQLHTLRRLRLNGCPFEQEHQSNLTHDPPSLVEICARSIIQNENKILYLLNHKKHVSIADTLKLNLTPPLYQYLSSSKTCSFCHGPYFDSFVQRGGWMERNGDWIPLEYRLCTAHWSDDQDRLHAMFSYMPPKNKSSKIATALASKPELLAFKNPVTVPKKLPSSSLSTSATITDEDTIADLDIPSSSTLKRKARESSFFLKQHFLI
jgi:hypothetical protein